ncbi:hypothetical protein DT381_28110, partial [Pseudomonas aeruginosa]
MFSSLKRFSFARKVLIIRKLTIVLLGSDHEPSSYTLVPGKGIEGVERSLHAASRPFATRKRSREIPSSPSGPAPRGGQPAVRLPAVQRGARRRGVLAELEMDA